MAKARVSRSQVSWSATSEAATLNRERMRSHSMRRGRRFSLRERTPCKRKETIKVPTTMTVQCSLRPLETGEASAPPRG